MRITSTFKTSSVVAGMLITGLVLAGCSGHTDTKPTGAPTQVEMPTELQLAQNKAAETLTSFLQSLQKADRTKVVNVFGTPGSSPEQQLENIRTAYPEIVSYTTEDGSVQQQVSFLQVWLTSPLLGNKKAKISVDKKKLQTLDEDHIQVSMDTITVKNLNTAYSTPPFHLVKKDGKWFLSN